jgi:hypothetical protein
MRTIAEYVVVTLVRLRFFVPPLSGSQPQAFHRVLRAWQFVSLGSGDLIVVLDPEHPCHGPAVLAGAHDPPPDMRESALISSSVKNGALSRSIAAAAF